MFRVQFRTKKSFQANAHYADPFQEFENPEYADEFYHEGQFQQNVQERNTCLFCGDLISNGHLAIVTSKDEYCMHTSCIVSGFALALNAASLLINVLFKKRKE